MNPSEMEELCRLIEREEVNVNLVDEEDPCKSTALHFAAMFGQLEAVKCLLEKGGANVELKNKEGRTVVHEAAYYGHLEVVEYLLEKGGAEVNAKEIHNGWTALH